MPSDNSNRWYGRSIAEILTNAPIIHRELFEEVNHRAFKHHIILDEADDIPAEVLESMRLRLAAMASAPANLMDAPAACSVGPPPSREERLRAYYCGKGEHPDDEYVPLDEWNDWP